MILITGVTLMIIDSFVVLIPLCMTSEIRAKKKAEAMLFLSLALLVELLLLFAAKILVQVVLSAALQ